MASDDLDRLRAMVEAAHADGTMDAPMARRRLAAVAPELLALAEAAERMSDSYGVSSSLRHALDALRAKLREVV